MGHHRIDTAELERRDDRPADVRSVSAAAGLDYDGGPTVDDARPNSPEE